MEIETQIEIAMRLNFIGDETYTFGKNKRNWQNA